MNKGLCVDVFQPGEQLIGQHEDRFELKAPATIVKQILEGGTQQIEDHDIVVAFNSVPANVWNAH